MSSVTRRHLILTASLLLLAVLAAAGFVIDHEYGRKLFVGAGLGLLATIGLFGLFFSQGWFRIVLWAFAIYPFLTGIMVLLAGGVIHAFTPSQMLLWCGVCFWPAIGCVLGEILNICRFSQSGSRRIAAWCSLAVLPLLIVLSGVLVATSTRSVYLHWRIAETKAALLQADDEENSNRALKAIQDSTHMTLQTPKLYDAILSYTILGNGQNRRFKILSGLEVFWVADRPMADGLILWLADGQKAHVALPEEQVLQNESNSEVFVSFRASVSEHSAKPLWSTFAERHITAVALTAGGQQITDALNVRKMEEDRSQAAK